MITHTGEALLEVIMLVGFGVGQCLHVQTHGCLLQHAGVAVGIVGGVLLRSAELSAQQIELLGFAGEIMLRLLKMLVLPLIAGSMVAGDPAVSRRALLQLVPGLRLAIPCH